MATEPSEEETAKQAEQFRQGLREAREKRFRGICPPKFHQTFDIDKTPAGLESVRMVLGWQFDPMGMFIIGETGRSKTWTVWTLLFRLIVEEGRSVMVIDGIKFANEALNAWSVAAMTEGWLERFVKPDILVIDDLAKRMTPSGWQALFAVLDRRSAKMKPVIATTNCSGERMAEMINDPELSEPLRRRMRENCRVVVF